ncbi:uncharacterized protein LOC128172981 [Crassostrea angulata]|uniref:uncharacterized protein LOC128172981 n=1 Tax=Magallana angulata TaxID=2784310 RepID=UPI0022B1584E|nr:uncharacterized protein LOC128172981 [Crassostrea angulata]
MATRCLTLEEMQCVKEKVISMYRELENVLKSKEYSEDLRFELEHSNPNYLTVLEKRIKDMEKSDHGIVVAGETSAGKSTLINRILDMRIFKGRNLETTSTIVKLRNSNRVEITTESDTGAIKETDLTNECDLTSKDGVKVLRDYLKNMTDRTASQRSAQIRSVQIGLPIPLLKGNTILVDTPGIGGSGEVTQKLIDYLPNAVAFVFVINVGSAGGMQNDRLPEILKSIVLLQIDNEMPCFDPHEVIFITNKWDTIEQNAEGSDGNSSEDDDVTKTWEVLKENIKHNWPSVKEENIYKMNLKDVSPEKNNESSKQFNKFMKALESTAKKAEHIRILQHLRFLKDFLTNISKSLDARLEFGQISEKDQQEWVEAHEQKIKKLTDECAGFNQIFCGKTKTTIADTALACYEYMVTEVGKQRVLNPPGHKPISNVDWKPLIFTEKVQERVSMYLSEYLQSKGVLQKFRKIKDEIASFYQKVSSDLSGMEIVWTEHTCKTRLSLYNDDPEISKASVVGIVLATSPLWLPLLATGVGLTIAASPIIFPVVKRLGRDKRKEKLINEEYDRCLRTVKDFIRKELESNQGRVIYKLLDKVTEDLVNRRMQSLKVMINQLNKSCKQILSNMKGLDVLAERIKIIEGSATELLDSFNQEVKAVETGMF